MFCADVVIHAINAALKDRKIVLCRIGMHSTARIFVLLVVDRIVACEFLADPHIPTRIIRHEFGLARRGFDDLGAKRLNRHIRNAH